MQKDNKIAVLPKDERYHAITEVFRITPKQYTANGILIGFEYIALKDFLKWSGLDPKKYTSILINCINQFIKGNNGRANN